MSTVHPAIDLNRDVNVHFEDRRRSRIFFAFLWFLYAIVFLTKNCFNAALPVIVDSGLLTKSQTGLITGLFYLVYTPGQIAGGIVCDKVSPEKLIKFGLLGGALANGIIFFNQNYHVMLGAWLFNSAAQFALWPAVFKIVSSQLVSSDRKQMIFFLSLASLGGLILSYLLAALLSDAWLHNFSFSAVSLLLLAIGMHLMCKWANPYLKWDPPKKIAPDLNHPGTQMSTVRLFASSGFFFVLCGSFLSVIVTQSNSSLASVILMENYEDISPAIGNLLSTFLQLSGLAGTLFAHFIVVRRIKNHPNANALFLLLVLPFCALFPMVGHIPAATMVVLMCVISCMAYITTLIRNNYSAIFVKYGKSGAAAGIMNASVSVSYMLAAYVIPLIQEQIGWTRTLVIWPILLAMSAPLFLLAGRQFSKFLKLSQN